MLHTVVVGRAVVTTTTVAAAVALLSQTILVPAHKNIHLQCVIHIIHKSQLQDLQDIP